MTNAGGLLPLQLEHIELLTHYNELQNYDKLQKEEQQKIGKTKQPDKIKEVDGIESLYESNLFPLPQRLLNLKNSKPKDTALKSETLRNFIMNSFEQRVGGDATTVFKEATEGFCSTYSDTPNAKYQLPFGRTILHYAAFFKYDVILQFETEASKHSQEKFLEYDVLGFTPLEYYFFNVEDRYGYYVDKLGDS